LLLLRLPYTVVKRTSVGRIGAAGKRGRKREREREIEREA
jgi:hypothetical protein